MRPEGVYRRRWARRLVVLAVITLGGLLTTDVARSAGMAPTIVHLLHGYHPVSERAINPGHEALAAPLSAFTAPLQIPPVLTNPNITLTAAETDVPILPGQPTKMWTFNGTFPGPTIRRPTGQPTNLTVVNNLPVAAGSISTHNHGNHSPSASDGQPADFLIPIGGARTYEYPEVEDGASERGAMQWYHDHVDMVTGRNVWMGMAGAYILDDPADPPTLPSGAFDVPLVVADRSFDANNQLVVYNFSPFGVVGNTILVNGVPQPFFDVGTRKYRFRILNASNYRTYVLELDNGGTMLQIGTDSGLLPAPVARTQIRLGPAERADVVIDFAGLLGQNIVLNNTAGSGTTAQIMQFRVTQNLADSSTVPASLRPLPNLGSPTMTRTWDFAFTGGHWTVNGLRFDHHRVDAQPVLGTTEKWIFRNVNVAPADVHTIHVHDVDQQLVSRGGNPPAPFELMKETWFLFPGETIEVILKFTDHLGRYVIHCHLLEHEDDGMMAQFEVVAPSTPTPTGTPTPTATATPTATPTPIPGDINRDGVVNVLDYGIWRQNFGQTNCGNPADINGDCLVDIRDYGIWRLHFGEGTPTDRRAGDSRPAAAVPAPRGTPRPALLAADHPAGAASARRQADGADPAVPPLPVVGGLLGLGGLAGWRARRPPRGE
jgi:spore coat protein A, manganese oxidase